MMLPRGISTSALNSAITCFLWFRRLDDEDDVVDGDDLGPGPGDIYTYGDFDYDDFPSILPLPTVSPFC